MRRRTLVMAFVLGAAVSLPIDSVVVAMSRAAPAVDQAHFDAKLRTVALGVSRPDGRDMADMDRYIAGVGGRKPATWTIWATWGDAGSRAFPTAAAKGARARGAAPMIWWQPATTSDLSDCRYASYANIVAGQHDEYITQFARDAKQYKRTLLLRFAHEANGSHFPWSVEKCGNDVATYIAAWRHVHDIFRSVGAKNVRFVWSVAKKACQVGGCNPYAEFYPGDAYVDYMAFSSFNWGAARDRWVSMYDGFERVTGHLGQISGKPIIAVETACNPEGDGDKVAWIREGYPEVYAKLPAIVAIVYLDADLRSADDPDWRLNSPPEALDAYADVVAMPQFAGRIPGR